MPEHPSLPDDGDITCASGTTTSNSSSPNAVLGRATISLARCGGDIPGTQKTKSNGTKGKKN